MKSKLMLHSSWNDRIHFVLLFEVATSVTIFQEKLPRASIRKLRGTTFEVAPMGDTLELIFKTAASLKTQHSMRIGAGISNLLVDRQKGHLQSIRAFTQALKVGVLFAPAYGNTNVISMPIWHISS